MTTISKEKFQEHMMQEVYNYFISRDMMSKHIKMVEKVDPILAEMDKEGQLLFTKRVNYLKTKIDNFEFLKERAKSENKAHGKSYKKFLKSMKEE